MARKLAKIHVRGMPSLMRDISPIKARKALDSVDREIGLIADELSNKMANDAPILTGALRNSLLNGVTKSGDLQYDINVDLDNVPYTWRQNYEHKTKRYFITRNAKIYDKGFGQRLQERLDNVW